MKIESVGLNGIQPVWTFLEGKTWTLFDVPEGYALEGCNERRGKIEILLKKVV